MRHRHGAAFPLRCARAIVSRVDTWILRDPLFLAHHPGAGHPERPARLEAVFEDLDARPVAGTRSVAPRKATRREIERVHTPAHVDRVAATAGRAHVQLDPDTATCPQSYEVALHAAGAVVQATEAVVQGEASGAFALVRPPGHHAEADRAMGFCLFNSVAVAAAHAVAELGCRRVAVLDPDVHHGNGTQHSFWGRRDVLYVSSHRYPFYPGTGWFDEIGEGEGLGFTVNLALPAGLGDADYGYLYSSVVGPIIDEYRPDLILVSAGFDIWKHDLLGDMKVSEEGFAALFGLFQRWADEHCGGRLVCALEGGYDPAGVVAGVRAALEVMTRARAPCKPLDAAPSEKTRDIAETARAVLAPHWRSLKR